MNAQEFQEKYVTCDDSDWGECYSDVVPFSLVHTEDGCEHKTCWLTKIYKMDEDYFEVTWTRDNSGYWGDGERYPGEVRKVVPVTKMVEVTTWEGV